MLVSHSERELLDMISAGADVWLLEDGWIGVSNMGRRRSPSPKYWAELRARGLPLPDPAGLPRLSLEAWYAPPRMLGTPKLPQRGRREVPPPDEPVVTAVAVLPVARFRGPPPAARNRQQGRLA